jgi:hypothetical protein
VPLQAIEQPGIMYKLGNYCPLQKRERPLGSPEVGKSLCGQCERFGPDLPVMADRDEWPLSILIARCSDLALHHGVAQRP